jgi:hypothetical protein
MVVKYYDKGGKEHRLNFKPDQPVFIASEIGRSGKFAEFRLDERKSYNETVSDWTTTGKLELSVAPSQGIALYPKGGNTIEIGPAVFDPKYI